MSRRYYYGFPPYVRVADRKKQAEKKLAQLRKKGNIVTPVVIEGRTIAKTFWGKAWCDHLESFSDYDNRLPRGRTYVRNGSVINLQIGAGKIEALVSGSEIYQVSITISELEEKQWQHILKECTGKIDSMVELLQGKFGKGVMEVITDPHNGLFPQSGEIKLACSCLDWAEMCKHVAAVLYGVGARLDERPEDLFLLRKIDHLDLITKLDVKSLQSQGRSTDDTLAEEELSSIFGIDLEESLKADKKINNKVKRVVRTKEENSSKKPSKQVKQIKSTTNK